MDIGTEFMVYGRWRVISDIDTRFNAALMFTEHLDNGLL